VIAFAKVEHLGINTRWRVPKTLFPERNDFDGGIGTVIVEKFNPIDSGSR
jgi:hypothetical protein